MNNKESSFAFVAVLIVISCLIAGGMAGYNIGTRGTLNRDQFRAKGLARAAGEYRFDKKTGRPEFFWTDQKWGHVEWATFGHMREYQKD